MNYLNRDKTFNGRVLYYDLQGHFLNGWRYVNGKVTASLQHISKEMADYLKTEPKTKGGDTECYLFEVWDIKDACYEWTQNNDYYYSYCYNEYFNYDYWYECYYTGDDNNGEVNPGGNNNNGVSLTGGIIRTNSLDLAGRLELERALQDKLQECGYNTMHRYIADNSYQINEVRINSSLQSPAAYYAQSNTLEFRSNEDIYNGFPEEFIHFFQNMNYPGGISQYDDVGRSNIEFEAKLMQDLLCNVKGLGCPDYGTSQNSKYLESYGYWIDAMTNGGTQMPDYNDLLRRDPEWENLNYWDFMEDFCSEHPNYDYPIDRNLTPQALGFIKNNCN